MVEENCVELGFEREEKARRSKWIRCMSKTQDPGNPDFHFARKRARHQFMNSLNFDQLIDLLKNEYCRCVDSDGTRVLAWRAGPDWTGLDWTGLECTIIALKATEPTGPASGITKSSASILPSILRT